MRCLKCGSDKLDENLVCHDCGYVSTKEIKKNEPIDIVHYMKKEEKNNFEKTQKVVFNVVIVVLIFLILLFGGIVLHFMKLKSNSKIMSDYENFKNNSLLFVLYISNDNKNDNMLTEYAVNYDYDFLKINYDKLAIKNKKYFQKELSVKKANNYIVIYSNGKIIAKDTVNTKKDIEKFLISGQVIPPIIKNPLPEIEHLDKLLASQEATLIYITFVNNELVNSKDEMLKNLCLNYNVNYDLIEGYTFSHKQQMKYINKFGFTEFKNELIVIVENGRIRNVLDKNYLVIDDYIEIFQNYDIIKAINEYLTYINILEFKNIIENGNKEVIVFGNSNCKYCDTIKYLLGTISKENNINIYYLELNDENIDEIIQELGYEGVITYPFTIVIENGKIIDYVIGISEEEYFINFFKKVGIIR